jgi:putative transposase
MRFALVHAEKAEFAVAAMCRLFGVSRQGYYAYVRSLESPRLRSQLDLQERIRAIHAEADGTYGSPRVLRELRRQGAHVGKRRVEATMRALGLCGARPRNHRVTTRPNPAHPVEGNHLARDFTASRPNERWVTDITYIWTREGWAYLAAIIDLYSRAVVGWSLGTRLSTDLPLAALDAALRRRAPQADLMHHSDRGCQYTSAEYRRVLRAAGITVSMSRRGNCWDNAVAESFFATLKTELVHRRTWASRIDLRAALFEYIEVFYNRRRLHSSIGYKTPSEVEALYPENAA